MECQRYRVALSVVFAWGLVSGIDIRGATLSEFGTAEQLVSRGAFTEAIVEIDRRLNAAAGTDPAVSCAGHLLKVGIYQQRGFIDKAHESLAAARKAAMLCEDPHIKLVTLIQVSDFLLATGKLKSSEESGYQALMAARKLADPRLLVAALNNWGIINHRLERYDDAAAAFAECLESIDAAHDASLHIRVLLNTAATRQALGDFKGVHTLAMTAERLCRKLPENYDRAFLTASVAATGLRVHEACLLQSSPQFAFDAAAVRQLLLAADSQAAVIGSNRLRSDATGKMGRLYELAGQHGDAEVLTDRALFFATQTGDADLLYRWYWQKGRLLKASGKPDESIVAYERAVTLLGPIRNDLTSGIRRDQSTFERSVKPVYYQLAQLYLEQSEQVEGDARRFRLRSVLDTVELLKTAELENYFHDSCVAALESRQMRLDELNIDAAVVYPLIFENSLEVFLIVRNRISRFSYEIDQASLEKEVRDLRRLLQKRSSKRFFHPARALYDWIIRPLEAELAAEDIHTLVVVPDGVMRLIPFATLHDGEKFLIEKFALATTPGLKLLDPQRFDRENLSAMIAGLSAEVQGHSALPSVTEEVHSIDQVLEGNVLLNEVYTSENVYQTLRNNPFRVVHLATHGQFDRNAEDTYLLTYDEKMTMDKLESIIKLARFRDEPIELLTLSACKTGVGDEKSALGLAGIAVKSGARSAIATLWYISDEAAMQVITEFYRQLTGDAEITKAQALQAAQVHVMKERRFRHPAYWGPYLLIGNWL